MQMVCQRAGVKEGESDTRPAPSSLPFAPPISARYRGQKGLQATVDRAIARRSSLRRAVEGHPHARREEDFPIALGGCARSARLDARSGRFGRETWRHRRCQRRSGSLEGCNPDYEAGYRLRECTLDMGAESEPAMGCGSDWSRIPHRLRGCRNRRVLVYLSGAPNPF